MFVFAFRLTPDNRVGNGGS